jgi:nitroreductase
MKEARTMKSIYTRRSIRKYKDKKIDDKKIDELLKAGMCAPSAGNEQPWHFIVIEDKRIMERIPEFHPYAAMVKNASHVICVCADLNLQLYEGYWIQDCSASTQNILLMAEELGIGSVWLGVYPREERMNGLKKLLKLPDNIVPFCLISLGYPDEQKPANDTYFEERVHKNMW